MKFTAFLVPKSELKNMMVKNNFFSQVTWWRTPLRRQDRRLNVANNKTSQASAVGSSPGLTNPSFFIFFCRFFAILREKTRKKRFKTFFACILLIELPFWSNCSLNHTIFPSFLGNALIAETIERLGP